MEDWLLNRVQLRSNRFKELKKGLEMGMPQRLIPVGSYSQPGLHGQGQGQGQGRHHEDGSPEQPRAKEDTGRA